MNMVAAADLFQDIMIGEVAHIVHGAVEIYLFVPETFGIFGKVIHAAHGDHAIDQVGAF